MDKWYKTGSLLGLPKTHTHLGLSDLARMSYLCLNPRFCEIVLAAGRVAEQLRQKDAQVILALSYFSSQPSYSGLGNMPPGPGTEGRARRLWI